MTATVFEKIIAFLAPLFLDTAAGDIVAARQAASASLAAYGTLNDRQARLAALSIAFSFGALDALSRAADRDLPISHVIRLRGNANALNRAAHQNEIRLDKRTAQPEAVAPDEAAALPASSGIEDLMEFVRPAAPAPAMSRQQRRFAERQEEKRQQREQEAARLEQRAAKRLAEKAEAARLAGSLTRPEAASAATM
jgi:hypothetical protein